MATFEVQVEALTGIAIDGSSDPTQTELSAFLQDGVKDVIHRMIEVKPEELARFCSTTDSGSNAFVAKVGKILSVAREHDSVSILRKCTKINPSDRYDATDEDSLNYRSKTNPGFYELNGKIHTVPVASATNDNNVVVTQLFYDTGVAYGDEVPDNFPESYAYLVAMYASMKSLQAKMGAKSLSTLSITAVPPDTPSAPSFTATSVTGVTNRAISASAPTFTKPTIGGSADELTDMTALDSDNTIDVLANQPEFDQWFATAAHFIEDEEDPELAQLQLQKISTYITAYQAEVQIQLNEFNEANVAYQQDVQEALGEMQVAAAKAQKDADFTQQTQIQEYANKLQRYQNEIAAYQADVGREVQEYTANIQEATTEYQWLQGQYAALKAEYDAAFAIMAPRQPQGARR